MPWLTGLVTGLPLAGLALADATKRAVLDEPVVFSDAAMLPLVVRHPSLYLPFAGTGWVIGGAGLGLLLLLTLAMLEPQARLGWPLRATLLALAMVLAALLLMPPKSLRRALARDPAIDTARFGIFACLSLYRSVAWAERRPRRAAHPADPPAFRPAGGGKAPHVVLVQAESFWDPRETMPDLPPGLLPHWDRLGAEALARGRLTVPGFGANTMRAEFAALTGIGPDGLGLDRFNPYFRFAVAGLRSLPRTLRAAGYRALVLHPFDRRFFGRHRVMPALGFERFESQRHFAGAARKGVHVADAAVAERVLHHLSATPGPALVFAITMQAHGPWPGEDPRAGWLAHLRDADAMLGRLADAAARLDRPLLLCVYGDHQPALPGATTWTDRRTDWLLWRSDRRSQAPTRRDIPAEGIFTALAETLRE
ncbi:LTA synthase family protein [Roseomonas marmotae]|uniref:LTA synthase family protein n=1 Tax=Roseomonas marmotae TaxID=2768161 RepID=A0ABS3KGD9_9PROT|nr:LTA synthase family protein [Roseomonas marmotae]MBO1076541.1 LTA synthase family protein [Roseomonas marmotae]QTI81843.1 LTA synthase family protein [Roseomonas marmotae]